MIEFRGVAKSFAGHTVLDGLELLVPAGALAVLLGPSGAGKSTALRMVNRLVQPDRGTVLVNGQDVAGQEPAQLRRRIGYVIQGTGLFPHQTVARNIATVPRLLGWTAERIARRTEELMALLRLDPALARRRPHQLSGGQAQRVGVARALAADPDILLMDEPFGALDPGTRLALQDELLRLWRTLGKTILLVTHDVDEAVRLASHMAVLFDGRLAAFGTPRALLDDPADPRVADLLGGEAIGLRRLAVRPAAELAKLNGTAGPSLAADATCRDALAAMLAARSTHAVLRDPDGGVVGAVRLDDLVRA
jgi:osmoprotectant transport system ATP-binding protein